MSAPAERKVRAAAARSAERALKEERLGLAVIAKAFLAEGGEPGPLLARLETLTQRALADPKTPARVRQVLKDGTLIVRTAIERELGCQQSLLDPHVGHVNGDAVAKVEAPRSLGPSGEEQLGLAGGDTMHDERVQNQMAVEEALVAIFRERPATDGDMVTRYRALHGVPVQSPSALTALRKGLVRSGRVKDSGSRYRGEPLWAVVEYELLRGR